MAYQSFEDLEVWKKACQLCVSLYQATESWKDYSLRDQMTRAAVSISSNIAEGADRDSSKEFLQFLSYSQGSAAELRTQLYIAMKLGKLTNENGSLLITELKSISAMIKKLRDSIRQKVEKK